MPLAQGRETTMHMYLIALGSNLGDRKYYIEQAIRALGSQCGKVGKVAEILESEPIGTADQPFFNTALTLESELEPEALLKGLLQIETDLGRIRSEHWGNRTIDLDIILWENASVPQVYGSETLTIPHPHALDREFVLGPAAEVGSDWIYPINGRTLGELWEDFSL